MKIYIGGYKTTVGSDEKSHPKIKLYKKRQKEIVNKLHQKRIEELDKILESRPNKTSYYCMSGDHINCPEYGKKSNNCYCPRCKHGMK